MEFLRQLAEGLAEAWQRLSLSARVNIVLAFFAVCAIIAAAVFWGGQPQYVTLSSHLAPSETASVLDALAQQGIPARTSPDNTAVLTPVRDRSRAQLALAEANLPIGRPATPGFELLQTADMMTTQHQQRMQFTRALQGEIQRQLNNLDFVDNSYVLIREAREELFRSYQEPSEASVTLQLRRPPSPRETKAIVNMVARAGGPNLQPKNITVITTDGTVLHDPADDGFSSMASSKLEYLADLERMRERRIEESLARLNVRGTARVSAKVDFEEREVTSEKMEEGTEVSIMTTTSSLVTTEGPPEGAPGALANIPPGAVTPGGLRTSEELEEEIINFEPSRTVTRTRQGPGAVEQYLVTLVVEGNYTTDAEGNRVYAGLEETDRQKYMDLAKAAVGEGNVPTQVTVYDQAFDIDGLVGVTAPADTLRDAAFQEWVLQLLWYMVQIALIVAGFFFVRGFLRRAIESPGVKDADLQDLPQQAPEVLRRQEVEQELRRMSSDEPELVSALLRTWMTQEED